MPRHGVHSSGRQGLLAHPASIHLPDWAKRLAAAAAASLCILLIGATPAAARELDCWEWVKVTASHVIHHRAHAAHVTHAVVHRIPRPHVRRVRHVAQAGPPRLHRIASHYVRRPKACPSREVANRSPIPGAEVPETPQVLLAELASPPPAAGDTAVDTAAAVPVAAAPEAVTGFPFPFAFLPGPGGVVIGGFPAPLTPPPPVIGQPPVVTPPGGPPVVTPPPGPPVVTPPVILPPDTPPTPVTGPPVIVPVGTPPGPVPGPGPVLGPPELPPVVTPVTPVTSPPPVTTPVGGVPEPGVWSLLICGLGLVGAALRRRRRCVAA